MDETGSITGTVNPQTLVNPRQSIVEANANNSTNISVIKAPPPTQQLQQQTINGTSNNRNDQNNNAKNASKSVPSTDKSSGGASNDKAKPKRSKTCTLL